MLAPRQPHYMPLCLLLAIVTPIFFCTMFYRLAPSVLANDIAASLGLDLAELAYICGFTWIAYGLMQLPSGMLVDVFGGRKCLFGICMLAALGNLCFAFCQGPGMAMLARFILGLGCAVVVPCSAVMAINARPGYYGRASGLFLAFGQSASIFAGAPLVMLAAWLGGWRAVMVFCAIVSLICALIALFFIPEKISHRERKNFLHALKANFLLMGKNACEVLRQPAIWAYCIWMMLMLGAFFTITSLWWAPYLKEVCHMDSDSAGQVISVVSLIMLPAQPLMILISDLLRKRTPVVRASTFVSLLGAIALARAGGQMNMGMIILSWCAFLLATAYVCAVLFTAIKEMFPQRLVGTATGCLQTFPYLFGVPLMQGGFGFFVEWRIGATGNPGEAYCEAMWLVAALIFCAFVASFLMREPSRAAA